MKLIAIEASVALILARIAVKTLRFQTSARLSGWVPGAAPLGSNVADGAVVDAVAKAVAGATARFGWTNVCLAESVAAKWLLERRGVRSTIYFGFRIRGSAAGAPAIDPHAHVAIHAWIQVGDRVVTGQDPSENQIIGHYN